MKHILLSLMVVCLVAGCGKKAPAPAQPTNTTSSASESLNPLNAPAQYLGAMNQAQKLANKTVDKASITKAIDMFNAQEERFPRDLQELVTQHFLQVVPTPPNGMVFDYNPKNGQFQVLKAPAATPPAPATK
jgi:hypothetical protein